MQVSIVIPVYNGGRSIAGWGRDLAAGRQIHEFGGQQKSLVFRLALSPDAKLLASIHGDHVVRIWETVP